MEHTTIAVDLAKNVFEVAVSREPGRVERRRRLSRRQFARFLEQERAATVVMEACGTAHHWARHAALHGHRVELLPPHAVRPYVLRDKTDQADARALLEARRNGQLRPVPVKSLAQHELAGLHRLRSSALATRTARINTVRGLLRELGITIPLGARHVVPAVRAQVERADAAVPSALLRALAQAADEIEQIERRVLVIERSLDARGKADDAVTRLQTISGVGLLTATALVAFVGDVRRFPSGRHFASYLGLTPRESSSGGRRRLGRISKRGDPYLRMLLIHGARSVLLHAKRTARPTALQRWALARERSRGHNKAAVALANKMARIVWAVWRNGETFRRIEEDAAD